MKVSKHIIYGFLFSLIIIPIVGILNSIVIFLSSFLIDVDHYFYYIFLNKDFSLKRAYKWFIEKTRKYHKLSFKKREESRIAMLYFHGLEIIILLFILGYFIEIFNYIAIGILLHLILDLLDQGSYQKRKDKISIFYDWYRFKKKLKRV